MGFFGGKGADGAPQDPGRASAIVLDGQRVSLNAEVHGERGSHEVSSTDPDADVSRSSARQIRRARRN